MKTLEMIEKYMNACKNIDSRFYNSFEQIFLDCISKCEELFESHKKYFEELEKNLDTKKAAEVNSRFKQIDLLRQIPQMMQKTNGPYYSILSQLKNSVSFSKCEILRIIEELNNLTEQQEGNIQGLNYIFKRLKEALISIRTLGEATTENSEFMLRMYQKIKESLISLVKRLEQEASSYLNITAKNYSNIRPLANIYEQIIKIEELSTIINAEVKTEIIKDFIQSIKSVLLKIDQECIQFQTKIMDKGDYKSLDNYYKFMNELLVQNQSAINLVRKHVNEQFQKEKEYKLSIQQNLLEIIYETIKKQKELKKQQFDLSFNLFLNLTEVNDFKDSEEEHKNLNNQGTQNNQIDVQKIKEQAEKIHKFFKLENDVKNYYEQAYYQNTYDTEGDDDDYLLKIFSDKIYSNFLDDLKRQNTVSEKPMQWKYIKLQGLKYLQDIDPYIHNSKDQSIKSIYDTLYDQVYFNPPQFLKEAQNHFAKKDFNAINDMCEKLKSLPINENTNAQNILNKIKNYLSDQAYKIYQQITKQIPYNNILEIEQAKQIARLSHDLIELKNSLDEYIQICSKNISDQIQEFLKLLHECFENLYGLVKINVQQNKFAQSMDLIKKSDNLNRILKSEFNNLDSSVSFDEIQKTNLNIQKIKTEIPQIIQQKLNTYLQIKEMKFDYNCSPKSLCENIEKIEDNDFIQKELQNFDHGLFENYKKIKTVIIKECESAQSIDILFEIEKKVEKYIEQTQYLPTTIQYRIKQLFQGISESFLSDFKKRQEKENEEFIIKFCQRQSSQDLSQFIEDKQQLILNDKTGFLKKVVKEKIQESFNNQLQQGKKNFNDSEFEQTIKFQVQEMSRFVKLPQLKTNLDASQVQNFYELTSKIAKLFQSSFQLCTKYFNETHSDIGEAIAQEQIVDDQYTRDKNFKILTAVLSSLIDNKELILQNLAPQLEQCLNNFLTDSVTYLRKMKSQHKDSLQKKIVDQNIAVINNMKFTNQVSKELYRIIDQIKDVFCNQNCIEFLQEYKNGTLIEMQTQTINWLKRDSQTLIEQPFTDIVRSEQDCIKLYKEIQNFCDTIDKARATEEKSLIKDLQQTQIEIIKADFYKYCQENIKIVTNQVENLNQIITDNDQQQKADQEKFGTLYKSLKSMQQTLKIEKYEIEKAISSIEGALKTKLLQLTKDAKECYIHGELKLGQLAIILCQIQTINENLVFFQDYINNVLNNILEDYSKSRHKAPRATVELQRNLRSNLPGIGSQGPMLAQNHPFFRGVNILEANKKFQSKKIDDVLKSIQGTELNDEDKQELKNYYEEFLGIYATILDENLAISTNSSQNKQQEIQLSGIVATIKNICYQKDSSQRWNEDEILKEIEWGINYQKKKKISLLLAYIFALWSLMNAEDYKKQQQQDASQPNLKGYLLQPHVAQILSILRIMGVGYSELYKEGSKFNTNWGKCFGKGKSDISYIRNNLVQIKTGEGKSIVLAVVSIIFALYGFNVDCACYSKYLSIRDNESFLPLFRALGLQNNIYYGTFNEIAERKLNQDGNIRDIIQCLVLKKEFSKNKNPINLNKEIRPEVLLIDEVDVFFSKSFYGNNYIPQTLIKHDNISCLTDLIWQNRQSMKDNQNKLKPDNPNKLKSPFMSLKQLKLTPEYKNALNLFKPEYQFILEEACKKMIIDVVEYESPNHHYVVFQGQIGYENQDQISTNATIGYQTLFAYYQRHKSGEIKDSTFRQQKAIGINSSYFSYAEVPLQYNIILGVTGTLETLSEPQKNIINNVYQINHQTLSPSVYSNNDSVFNRVQNLQIIQDSSEYYMKLINEMAMYLQGSRPILLFFEDNKSLSKFQDSENFKDKKYSYQILSEIDSDQEKKIKVLRATQASTITLSTKNFGRGTDFCCYDQKVIEAGGLVVIQTFLSEDISEETQIRGRTGRQGTKGTFIMFLNLADLSKFNIEPIHIEFSLNTYQTLCLFRDNKLSNEQHETTQNRDNLKKQHDFSIQMMKIINKNIIKDSSLQMIDAEQQSNEQPQEEQKTGELQQINQEKIINYLYEMNKGITLETDQKFMKVLVLMDVTGSMSLTLQKTKNCVRAMFQDARKALKAMEISEELILMKIGGYRNYNSPLDEIFEVSPEWSSDPNTIAKFLSSLETKGGHGNEAMEIGLQYANKEISNDQGIPLSMIIIIGDAPPNTLKEVESKRKEQVGYIFGRNHWKESENYKVSTYWENELKKIEQAKVQVNSFYLLNQNLKGKEAESSKASLKREFEKLAVNEGKCSFIDIHNNAGQKKIQEFLTYLIVYRTTEINKGQEKAIQAVSKMEVAFT